MCVPGCEEAVRRALTRRGFVAGVVAGAAGTVAAPARAQAPRSFQKAVDLTHTMSPEFPTFFGVPGIEMQRQFSFQQNGFNLHWWRLNEHAGTHVDPPIHFSAAGATLDQLAVDHLVVPLCVLDVTAKAAQDPDYLVSRQDLADWESRHGQLPDNCCVAMNSGWAKHLPDAAKFTGKDAAGTFHFPGFGPDAAAWMIAERRVAGIAVDTLSLDHGRSKDFKTHYLWLPSGRWGVENVANLDAVPPAGATLVVGAAKVKGATGGPARLIALV